MRKPIIAGSIRRYTFSVHSFIIRNGLFVLFCLLLFGGVLWGALNSRSADEELLKRLDFILQTNYSLRSTQGLISAFTASFASSVMLLLLCLLSGLSLFGSIPALVIPFFKGYGYGLSAGFLYGAYGMKGIGYNLLVILPGMFFSSIIICSASLMSFCSSLKLCSYFFSAAVRDDPREQMKSYLLSILRCLLLCALAAAVDMICSLCFSWIFNFSYC
ncbi:MAG: stage II sporulation protein M [Clostridia bacterium]|nr:stage II sporulation protein M [Clostridia bacterium]